MPAPASLSAVTDGLADFSDVLAAAGGLAAIAAIIGMLLVLPLYLTQRREIKRLLKWQELEPERGDEGAPAATAPIPARPTTATALSPAERITLDRPALERITAERAALESPSLWRRLLARGPRHPLVLTALTVVVAVVIVAAVALTASLTQPEGGDGPGLDRGEVELVVLNGSSTPALAGKVADSLGAAGFEDIRTGTTGTSRQTIVLFAPGSRRAARVLGRELGVQVIQPLDRETRSRAPGAEVVVVAGEDRA
jgi:hypothetical protein